VKRINKGQWRHKQAFIFYNFSDRGSVLTAMPQISPFTRKPFFVLSAGRAVTTGANAAQLSAYLLLFQRHVCVSLL
jgi:hypothetical protein